MYVDRSVEISTRVRAEAALLVSAPASWVSHLTAAELWGLCPPEHSRTHVTVPALSDDGTRRRGIRSHEMRPFHRAVPHGGLPISSPLHTFLESAELVDLVDLVVIADQLLAHDLVTARDLLSAADAWRGRGARVARRAARFARAGVDSPMESRLRMLIVLSGLPEPRVDFRVHHADGTLWMRFDLYYEDAGLLVEYDGRQHAENDQQWDHDISRREDLDRMNKRLIVVRSRGIYAVPEETLVRISLALVERGASCVPSRFRSEWRQYFGNRGRRPVAS